MKKTLLVTAAVLIGGTALVQAALSTNSKSTEEMKAISPSLSANDKINPQSCDINPVKATYSVTQYQQDKVVGSYPLVIYRNHDHIIYDYPQGKVADMWYLEPNDQLSLSRYFAQEKRAIDYDSSDLKNIGNSERWDKLYQLIDISHNQPLSHTDQGCMSVDEYKDDHKTVHFLTTYKLPKSITFSHNDSKRVYTLDDIQTSDEITAKIQQFNDYEAMDYADIGDNEADPFINKMITMGFIEHTEHHYSQGAHNPLDVNASQSAHNHS